MWRAWRYAPEILTLQSPGAPAAGFWKATWIRCATHPEMRQMVTANKLVVRDACMSDSSGWRIEGNRETWVDPGRLGYTGRPTAEV